MGKINWARVFLCGLVTGFVWTILSIIILIFFGGAFRDIMHTSLPQPSAAAHMYLFFENLASGIWGVWLYAMIRAQAGPGPKTAVLAGIGWWVIVSLQSSKWVALGFVPTKAALGLLLPTLPAIILATLAGAWLYKVRD